MTLLIQQAKFELHQKQTLNLPHFAIEPQQYWVVVGSNGSGKSAFALALQNELPLQEGDFAWFRAAILRFSVNYLLTNTPPGYILVSSNTYP